MAQGQYPAIMRQDLDQIISSVLGTNRLTWTFPSVPQGLAWTGSISVTPTSNDVAATVAVPNPTITANLFPTLQAADWVLLRNGVPLLYWQGLNTIYNVRATSQDVIQVVAMFPRTSGAPPVTQPLQARWIGQSCPTEESPFAWPYVAGPSNGPSQIFTQPSGPANDSLVGNANYVTTLSFPIPGSQLTGPFQTTLKPPTASSAVLIPATSTPFYLYQVMLAVSIAQLSTVAGEQDWLVQIKTTAGGQLLHSLNPGTVPGTVAGLTATIDFKGLIVSAGDGLTVSWGAYGGTMGSINAIAEYVVKNSNPG